MTAYAVLALVLLAVGLALALVWTVLRDFFAALDTQYAHQLRLDRAWRSKYKRKDRTLAQRLARLGRRALFLVKRPLYLLATTLGLKKKAHDGPQ